MPKVDEIDLNGESVAPEAGQAENTEEKTTTEETKVEETQKETETEDVDSLKERLKKSEDEKENYKKGMLKYKDLSLKKTEDKTEDKDDEEEYPEWDESSKKFQKQTVKEAESKAEAKAQAIVESYNEKSAISQFVEKNPELADESKWSEIIANYTPTHGKGTPKDVLKDLNRALLLTRYDNGEIDKITAEAEQKGKSKGKAEAQLADKATVSKTTSKTVKEGNVLSPGAINLANKMRVDLKKLAEEDLSKPAEIKF